VVLLGQLVIATVGALTITAEYSTQAIRTSLTVMPRRGVLYGAKAAVFAAVALAVAFPASFLAWFVGQRLLVSTHVEATLGQPNVLRAILASAIFVVLCGLFSYGLGAVLRSTAGAITAAYGFLFLLPQLARALPTSWYNDAIRWLPGGQFDAAISTSGPPISSNLFSAWGEIAVFAGYTSVVLIAGAVLLRRRDG
jgi:ABC-2 type transport system permease protein